MTTERALSDETLYDPRPVVKVDGERDERLDGLVLSVAVRFEEGGVATCELRVSEVASDPAAGADWAFQDARVLDLGVRLQVSMGDAADPVELFDGRVSGLELELGEQAPPELVVYAEDALFKARLRRRTKLWTDTTVAAILRDVAQHLGLTPEIDGLDAPVHTEVQLDESDLAFLRRLLDRHDADLAVRGDRLTAQTRANRAEPEVVLVRGSQLRSVRIFADLAHQATHVSTAGFDVDRGEHVHHTAAARRPGPGAGRTGAETLDDTLGERREHIGHVAVRSADEARAVAEAAFDQRARRFVTAEGTAAGNPRIRLGSRLTLQGCGPRFDNTYDVLAVTHRYDLEAGYQTDFRAACAFFGEGQ
jgi:phage protein D